LLTWKFKDGKSHIHDQLTFKRKVKDLLQRAKPQGLSLLTLEFTNKSASVYAVFVSNKSNNSYMFRISSHATFSYNHLWTYYTNNYVSFKALEQQIHQDLKDRHANLLFSFELEDYLFYMSTLHLQRQKQHLLVEKNLFKKNHLSPKEQKVFVKNKNKQVSGVIVNPEYVNLVQKMIKKGYISGHPINKLYSLIFITHLFHGLAKHYKTLYADQTKKIDFNLYFDLLVDTKNVLAKRDLGGKECPETKYLWAFKDQQFFLNNFSMTLKEILESTTFQHLNLLALTSDAQHKLVNATFTLKSDSKRFVNVTVASKKVNLLHDAKTFRTTHFYDVSSLETEIKIFLSNLKEKNFLCFTYNDYLQLKELMKLAKQKKLLTVPANLSNKTLYKFKKGVLIEKTSFAFIELIDDQRKITQLKRLLILGLAHLVAIDHHYSALVVTPTAKKLLKTIGSSSLKKLANTAPLLPAVVVE